MVKIQIVPTRTRAGARRLGQSFLASRWNFTCDNGSYQMEISTQTAESVPTRIGDLNPKGSLLRLWSWVRVPAVPPLVNDLRTFCVALYGNGTEISTPAPKMPSRCGLRSASINLVFDLRMTVAATGDFSPRKPNPPRNFSMPISPSLPRCWLSARQQGLGAPAPFREVYSAVRAIQEEARPAAPPARRRCAIQPRHARCL
jgi:hypothetical protein